MDREFYVVLRRALLMIVAHIEKQLGITDNTH